MPVKAMPGQYRFATSQCAYPTACNMGTLTVLADGRTFSDFVIPYSATCTPPADVVDVLTSNKGAVLSMDADLEFEVNGTASVAGATITILLTGQFDTAGNVSGNFDFHISGNDNAGTHHECDTGLVTFSGKLVSG
jgi:hypothetical protein